MSDRRSAERRAGSRRARRGLPPPAFAMVVCLGAWGLAGSPPLLRAQVPGPPPLLPEASVKALASELSGASAKRTVQDLTQFHRMRGSRGFRAAAERVRDRLLDSGLSEVEIVSLPADGRIFYGTQRSRPAWDADFAELWEQKKGESGAWVDEIRRASWAAAPIVLAQDSASGALAAELVDVGAGKSEADYAGKEVRGRFVLTSSQPDAVYALAVDRFGAGAIVSYAQNQATGWSKDDDSLIRWGHLKTFPEPKTFAFMVSLKVARAWQERLAAGGGVRLRGEVRAGQHPGSYDIATAVIPGRVRDEEVVLSCHLDHQLPGANDNASGCATILEVARTLGKLRREGKLPEPRRTIRFVFPPEVEGTIALLNARPALARTAKAAIHLDMVGGDAAITKAVFHVTRNPKSNASAVDDVAEAFGRFVNEQSYAFAATGAAPYPLVDPEGSKGALLAQFVDFTPGSDHEVWADGSFRVPAIYLNDWPDRYIHTSNDTVANIDATKLLRSAFLAAASATYLAGLEGPGLPALREVVKRQSLVRMSEAMARCPALEAEGLGDRCDEVVAYQMEVEAAANRSLQRFVPAATGGASAIAAASDDDETCGPSETCSDPFSLVMGFSATMTPGDEGSAEGRKVYRRAPEPRGPMEGFSYEYLADQLAQKKVSKPALLTRKGLWGDDYAYEALNLVDGTRDVRAITRALSATYGPVPEDEVSAFLATLEKVGVVEGK